MSRWHKSLLPFLNDASCSFYFLLSGNNGFIINIIFFAFRISFSKKLMEEVLWSLYEIDSPKGHVRTYISFNYLLRTHLCPFLFFSYIKRSENLTNSHKICCFCGLFKENCLKEGIFRCFHHFKAAKCYNKENLPKAKV